MNLPDITPEEITLVKNAKEGKPHSFTALFKRYKYFVDHVLYEYVKDMDEARDLTNVVFLKVYQKLPSFTEYKSFGGWLRVISNRVAVDYLRLRSKHRFTEDVEKDWVVPKQKEVNETDLINRLIYQESVDYFKTLPHPQGRINELYYCNSYTVDEISKALFMPLGTVKSVLFRTRKELRKLFKH